MSKTMKSLLIATMLCLSPWVSAETAPMCQGMQGMMKGDVQKADFLKNMEAFFDHADANKDGVVTQAERQEARTKMKANCPRRGMRASAAAAK